MKKVIRVSESNLVKLIQKVLVEEKHINPKKLNEQADLGYDIATIMGELNKYNSEGYLNKNYFKDFLNSGGNLSAKRLSSCEGTQIAKYYISKLWREIINRESLVLIHTN